MDIPSPTPTVERQVRCWCGHASLEDWSPDYWRCPECQTLVVRAMRGEEISQIRDDDQDFYGKNYYLHHVQEDYGLPDLETRARADLPERCLHWLRTLLKFVSGPGARTLELGCGHGGFVAMQRWAGLDATGLELSPWLVEQARAWFDVPVLAGRLEDQPLDPASFDAVALMDVLEHLPDPRQTMGRAVSLLRSPESFLLIQTPSYPVGWSYEAMVAQNHPFLVQIKPSEHLYLFSEGAVARLCAELGVGQVRFEPAIFAHYDLFAVASAQGLRERSQADTAAMLLTLEPRARETLALLDLAEERRTLTARLVEQGQETSRLHALADQLWPQIDVARNAHNLSLAQLADLQGQFATVEADNAARLQVIQDQGTELARLHALADTLWPQIDAARNERNLAAAQLADLQGQFAAVEADNAARLQVIQDQGAELARLHALADTLWPQIDVARNAHNLSLAQLADVQGQFAAVEADNAARLEVIRDQGRELGEFRAQLSVTRSELADLRAHYEESEADRAARLQVIQDQGRELGEFRAQLSTTRSELADLHAHFKDSEVDRADRLQVIQDRGTQIDRLQALLATNEGERAQLAADLEVARGAHATLSGEHARLTADTADLRGAHTALVGERTRLVADVDSMNAAHADLAAAHTALRAQHKTLNQHWTTWVLKRLRLWPL